MIRSTIWLAIACVAAITLGALVGARAHEWADDARTQQWFESRVQPDAPAGHTLEWLLQNGWSCCGEADSYWADDFERTADGQYVAIITDGRDDKRPDGRLRQHRPPGTRIVVPDAKIAREGNPTGHGIIFMPVTGADHPVLTREGKPIIPYCYYAPSGA